MTSVALMRAAAVWPLARRISRAASAVIIAVICWPPMESFTCADARIPFRMNGVRGSVNL
jgi:hypothetical protein